MKLFVGLGNPGREYQNTYHNLGFLAVDALAKKLGTSFSLTKFSSLVATCTFQGEKIVLIKPLTYMNLSGVAVKSCAKYLGIEPKDICVFVDDIDLPKGTLRFRAHGSGGTHNGLKNIVYELKSEEFARIKIGVGNNKSMDLKDYVLSKIDQESFDQISPCLDEAVQKALELLKNA